jgi:hypothetical protein
MALDQALKTSTPQKIDGVQWGRLLKGTGVFAQNAKHSTPFTAGWGGVNQKVSRALINFVTCRPDAFAPFPTARS